MKTRRSILAYGLLTAAGTAAAPLAALAAPASPGWLGQLQNHLSGFAVWTRVETGEEGVPELHCGVRDAQDFAHRLPRLADEKTKVRAGANRFALSTGGGHRVCIVLHVITAA